MQCISCHQTVNYAVDDNNSVNTSVQYILARADTDGQAELTVGNGFH